VEAIETHMSWVFLTDRHAYKLKKPVRLQLLDFSTLQDRRRSSEAEVHWNRRLAPGVYLGVVPLGLDERGGLVLGREDPVVEWLVHMLRLPADRMLDRAIAAGNVEASDIRRVAETLSDFYRRAPRVDISEGDYRDRFVRDIEEIGRALDEISPIPSERTRAVSEDLLRFTRSEAGLLGSRAREGRIVEAHGDLRPEHVCLLAPPAIIDCLEFSASLRALDPADELSFLSVECDLAGGPSFIEPILFEACDERPAPALVRFYKAFRAFVRAKIAVWHVRDPEVRYPEKWFAKAGRYVEAAERLAREAVRSG
jgi:aminoglycoside phosphotransferase family enzyme